MTNMLYYGDNLDVIRADIPDKCVDLFYLDPPFNSNRSYSVLFKTPKGIESDAQITAFENTLHGGARTEKEFDGLRHGNFLQMQILTIEGLLDGTEKPKYVDMKSGAETFKKEVREKKKNGEQETLDI